MRRFFFTLDLSLFRAKGTGLRKRKKIRKITKKSKVLQKILSDIFGTQNLVKITYEMNKWGY